jgi:hypothetical protein
MRPGSRAKAMLIELTIREIDEETSEMVMKIRVGLRSER